jgi:hypothetical protein
MQNTEQGVRKAELHRGRTSSVILPRPPLALGKCRHQQVLVCVAFALRLHNTFAPASAASAGEVGGADL